MSRVLYLVSSAGNGGVVPQHELLVEGYCGVSIAFPKVRNEVEFESVRAWQAMHGSLFRCPTIAQITGENALAQIGSWKIRTIVETDEQRKLESFTVYATTTNLPKRGRATYRNYVFTGADLGFFTTTAEQIDYTHGLMAALTDGRVRL